MLNDKEFEVLMALINDIPIETTAEKLNLTRERVRQIENKVIKKLNHHYWNYICRKDLKNAKRIKDIKG